MNPEPTHTHGTTPQSRLTIGLIAAGIIVFGCLVSGAAGLLYLSGALTSPQSRTEMIQQRRPTFNLEDTFPAADAAALAATQEALLDGYAWVDQNAGIARIPIERAMALVVATAQPQQTAEPSG